MVRSILFEFCFFFKNSNKTRFLCSLTAPTYGTTSHRQMTGLFTTSRTIQFGTPPSPIPAGRSLTAAAALAAYRQQANAPEETEAEEEEEGLNAAREGTKEIGITTLQVAFPYVFGYPEQPSAEQK